VSSFLDRTETAASSSEIKSVTNKEYLQRVLNELQDKLAEETKNHMLKHAISEHYSYQGLN
jgi:hypothetical protein